MAAWDKEVAIKGGKLMKKIYMYNGDGSDPDEFRDWFRRVRLYLTGFLVEDYLSYEAEAVDGADDQAVKDRKRI